MAQLIGTRLASLPRGFISRPALTTMRAIVQSSSPQRYVLSLPLQSLVVGLYTQLTYKTFFCTRIYQRRSTCLNLQDLLTLFIHAISVNSTSMYGFKQAPWAWWSLDFRTPSLIPPYLFTNLLYTPYLC